MTSAASSSEKYGNPADAYGRLHPKIQEWIWDQRWQQLRPTQAEAVGPILQGDVDVVISAPTASGKTEAAWLPICSALARDADTGQSRAGAKALYVSPLKALINDQFDRLQVMFEYVGLPAYPRHGDIAASTRRRFQANPDGLLLITPESLEALFVTQGPHVPNLLFGLRYIVIDELHSFIGTERGAQLQSLLNRVELAVRRRIPRIALSATLADGAAVGDYLRPGDGQSVLVISGSDDDTVELRMQLRGYVRSDPSKDRQKSETDHAELSDDGEEVRDIADHLFKHLRGNDNLAFANSRQSVEIYADKLRRMCEQIRLPNEFFPHHGNLSKDLREDVEKRLKSSEHPTTAVCTSTLEMGIDIGSVDSVAQIGAPGSVSALRQRLVRSGRRDKPAVLRLYVAEDELSETDSPVDQLRAQTIQTIAVVELLLERWYEPPNMLGLHLSTLIQQVLSVIAQHGGATAAQLFKALCAHGPFIAVNQSMFLQLLRDLGRVDLVVQASDGTLLPGGLGERIINHYSFYSAFQTADEYRLMSEGRTLGSMPVNYPVQIDSYLVFAGRRWKIVEVDTQSKVIELVRSAGGRPPSFISGGIQIADGVRWKMRSIYEGTEVPTYLDSTAKRLLQEGRASYRRYRLRDLTVLSWGRDSIVFPWRGDRVMNTLTIVLASQGLEVSQDDVALTCTRVDVSAVMNVLCRLLESPLPTPASIAERAQVKAREKYDVYLGDALLNETYAARDLDVPTAWQSIRELISAQAAT